MARARVWGLLIGLLLACPPAAAAQWRATWGAGMGTLGTEDETASLLQTYFRLTFPDLRAHDQTLREVVRVSVGGHGVRVRLSNALGDGDLVIGAASVAQAGTAGGVVAGSLRPLRFAGVAGATVPAGGELTSDPVDLPVGALDRLAVSIHVARSPAAPTLHFLSLTGSTTTLPATGDHTMDAGGAAFVQGYRHWPWLAGVEVDAPQETGSVVAFGDSITDGAYVSNAFTESKDQSWPSHLAQRLLQMPADRYARGVVNVGISGNAVVAKLVAWVGPPAVDRFDRDVLDRAGVTHMILFEGTNDLGDGSVTADQVIAGLRQLVERAHARHIKVIGATITPRSDDWPAEKEAARQRINTWIRSYRGYDGVIGFDATLADPSAHSQLRPDYDSGDHLHPGPAGRQAMADAIDLSLLQCTPSASLTITRRISGTTRLGACHSHRVSRVTVTVSRRAGGRCRFLGPRGRLLPARRCSAPVLLRARGTTRWRLPGKPVLPAGTYRVSAAAHVGPVVVRSVRSVHVR